MPKWFSINIYSYNHSNFIIQIVPLLHNNWSKDLQRKKPLNLKLWVNIKVMSSLRLKKCKFFSTFRSLFFFFFNYFCLERRSASWMENKRQIQSRIPTLKKNFISRLHTNENNISFNIFLRRIWSNDVSVKLRSHDVLWVKLNEWDKIEL